MVLNPTCLPAKECWKLLRRLLGAGIATVSLGWEGSGSSVTELPSRSFLFSVFGSSATDLRQPIYCASKLRSISTRAVVPSQEAPTHSRPTRGSLTLSLNGTVTQCHRGKAKAQTEAAANQEYQSFKFCLLNKGLSYNSSLISQGLKTEAVKWYEHSVLDVIF